MHPSFGLWRLIKSKSRLTVELDHLPTYLRFHLSNVSRRSSHFVQASMQVLLEKYVRPLLSLYASRISM